MDGIGFAECMTEVNDQPGHSPERIGALHQLMAQQQSASARRMPHSIQTRFGPAGDAEAICMATAKRSQQCDGKRASAGLTG